MSAGLQLFKNSTRAFNGRRFLNVPQPQYLWLQQFVRQFGNELDKHNNILGSSSPTQLTVIAAVLLLVDFIILNYFK